MEISGSGSFASNHSLLSVSQWNKVNDGVMIFDEFGACCEGNP